MYVCFAPPKVVDKDKMRESLIQRTRTYNTEGVLHVHSQPEPCTDECELYKSGEKAEW